MYQQKFYQSGGDFASDMSNDNKTNLIINYLPQMLTDDEMYHLFASIGNVKNCKIIRDKNTGYSYGFGFVEYCTAEEAQAAISSLNGYELENKHIKVALARPPGEQTKGANLYVRNVPLHYDEEMLRQAFTQFGNIVQSRVLMDLTTNQSKGVGFVLYENKVDAERAIKEMNGVIPKGGNQALQIKFADDNAKKVRPPQMGYGMSGGFGPRPGGPMRGPGGGSRMRYNPMSAPAGGNGYGAYGGGYQGGYGSAPPKGRGSSMGNQVRGGFSGGQFAGAGDGADGVILFVYNIGNDATEHDLFNLFSPYGRVKKTNVIWDHAQNKCKGFGFVTMSTLEEAKYAIEYLNGFYYKSAPLQVSIKNEK